MNANECYELLGISSDYSSEDYEIVINNAYELQVSELWRKKGSGQIDSDEFNAQMKDLETARAIVLKDCTRRLQYIEYYQLLGIPSDYSNEDYEEVVNRAYELKVSELWQWKGSGEIDNDEFNAQMKELETARKIVLKDCKKRIKAIARETNDTGAKETGKTKSLVGRFAAGFVTGALIVGIAVGAHSCAYNKTLNNGDFKTTQEQTEQTTEPTVEEEFEKAIEYGDIHDEELVQERAKDLAIQLRDANIVNPVTTIPYTEEEIITLIQYLGGIYTPETPDEINDLYTEALNLFIAPINTDAYLYHVVYATGNDDFKDMAVEAATQVKHTDYAKAFSEYGTNGVYPLVRWFQDKREAIYSTTNREDIESIYVEVGQVMADIMKGNGGTITVLEDDKEVTYTYTSEQILASPASAFQITTEAQLIFANKLERRDEKNNIVESSKTTWEVYNKLNGEDPDYVTLDEMQAWINNGCNYEWGIDEVIEDGQTFGQRIEGDVKGTAQNNYAMNGNNKSLTK